tara:strand:- start:3597 stop:4028 length:432 start_codon:yes stop_codon:yes gene_type:complete
MPEMTLLQMQQNYNDLVVAELLEKTKRNGILWEALDSVTFQATMVQPAGDCPGDDVDLADPKDNSVAWKITVKKTPLGNISSTATLEILKDDKQWVFLRDTNDVETLFDVVELLVLQLDNKLKEALQFVQDINTGLMGHHDAT